MLRLLIEADRCCLWMNSERCWGGLDEQFLVGVDEQDPVVLPLDEQDPDLLQPPPATVHPRAHVHPASTVRYSTGYCSTSPFHGLLFNHPSTGYCSSTPPPSTVHPALHGMVLFILPSTGSCSSSPNRLDRSGSYSSIGNTTGSCSSTPTRNCSSKPPQQYSLFIKEEGSSARSASVSSSSEGIA